MCRAAGGGDAAQRLRRKKDDAPVRKADSDTIIITESYAEEGHYTDSLDNSWTYSYHVPQLTADTKGARAINEAIDQKFGVPVRSALEDMEKALSLGCVSVAWKSYRCDDDAEPGGEGRGGLGVHGLRGVSVRRGPGRAADHGGAAGEAEHGAGDGAERAAAARPPPLTSRATSRPMGRCVGAGAELDRGRGERERGDDALRG